MAAKNATPLDAPHPNWVRSAGGHSRYSQVAEAILERDVRHQMIAEAAYFRAQRRGFEPGHDLEDWLAAESEVDTGLTLGMFCS